MSSILDLDAVTYVQHSLHRSDRVWSETNCYVDLWIEVLHALGLEPLAAGAFALATDFEIDQWTFFKFPPEDLRTLYGIEVYELNVWRSVLDHVVDHVAAGRPVTVEVDAFHLPDTAGVSYGIDHVKTTILPNMVDVAAKRLGYFHNASYFELGGEDFEGLFRLADDSGSEVLVPYVETVRLDALARRPQDELREVADELLSRYIEAMPVDNPINRMKERVESDLSWLTSAGIDGFHKWAFGMFRQCGASAEVAAGHLFWLAAGDSHARDLRAAADSLMEVARGCKALEFALARLARGRSVDIDASFRALAHNWERARTTLADHRG